MAMRRVPKPLVADGQEAPLVPGLQPASSQPASAKPEKKPTKAAASKTVRPAPKAVLKPVPSTVERWASILVGKGHISFYPCGKEESEEEGPRDCKGKPQPCSSQCVSHTERLQLAALDLLNGVEPSFLTANEKSFLDSASKEERKRLFNLTDRERALLDGASLDEGEVTQLPVLPVSTTVKKMLPFPLAEPVEHPLDTAEILKNTISRYLRWF